MAACLVTSCIMPPSKKKHFRIVLKYKVLNVDIIKSIKVKLVSLPQTQNTREGKKNQENHENR